MAFAQHPRQLRKSGTVLWLAIAAVVLLLGITGWVVFAVGVFDSAEGVLVGGAQDPDEPELTSRGQYQFASACEVLDMDHFTGLKLAAKLTEPTDFSNGNGDGTGIGNCTYSAGDVDDGDLVSFRLTFNVTADPAKAAESYNDFVSSSKEVMAGNEVALGSSRHWDETFASVSDAEGPGAELAALHENLFMQMTLFSVAATGDTAADLLQAMTTAVDDVTATLER